MDASPLGRTAPELPDTAALLARGAITMAAQPLVRIADTTTVGYEMLARAPGLPGVPPNVWLADAAAAGHGHAVELACLAAVADRGPGPGDPLLFLNVSPGLLLNRTLEADLDRVLAQISSHVLEITEEEAVGDYTALTSRMTDLASQHGSLLAVDDVGSGYASMAHVLKLSPHFIKIDRQLISGLHTDRQQRALVSALAAFATAIGATTIAEGVESVDELEAVADAGVDIVQGYLLGRPGTGWPTAQWPEQSVTATPSMQGRHLRERIAATQSPTVAAEVAVEALVEDEQLLPSVYLERSGVLRCAARRGQWLVLDGLLPGVGMTGAAFQSEKELFSPDVTIEARYRAAIPGIRSEISIPLRAKGRVLGVLNAESFTAMTGRQVRAARSAARVLEEQLGALPDGSETNVPLDTLCRVAPLIIAADTIQGLGRVAAEAAALTANMESAAMWLCRGGRFILAGAAGPQAPDLQLLRAPDLARLASATDQVASCHSGGASRDLSAGPLRPLRDLGALAALVVPLRVDDRTIGLLLATSISTAQVDTSAVVSSEVLGMITAMSVAHIRVREADFTSTRGHAKPRFQPWEEETRSVVAR